MCPHARHRRPSSSHSWAISQLSAGSPRHHPVRSIHVEYMKKVANGYIKFWALQIMRRMRILFLILNLHIIEIISSLDDGQSRVFLAVGLEPCAYLSEDSLVWSIKPLQTPGDLIPVRVFSSVIFVLCVWSSSRFQTATDDSQVGNLAFLKEIQDLAEDIFETMGKAKSLQKLWLKRSETSGKILKRYPWFFWGEWESLMLPTSCTFRRKRVPYWTRPTLFAVRVGGVGSFLSGRHKGYKGGVSP